MAKTFEEILPVIPCGPTNRDDVRRLSTDQLKRMWDCMDDTFEHLWDDIHAEMNERGEGEYVAV